ncbi:hypothetical protein [Undibacterium luofuense]|uniref:Uncharacterized protein n=1 Tax=Undibacterium luofuense TaxID=2828733 RepID=A0A941DPH4_9BURK|nr:hypothetical protein [Undibacterium luofuense]MBR7783424.1 hypothetical protein [Undibacterium luofuense]
MSTSGDDHQNKPAIRQSKFEKKYKKQHVKEMKINLHVMKKLKNADDD